MAVNEEDDEYWGNKRTAAESVVQKTCMISGFILDLQGEYQGQKLMRLSEERLS